MKKPASPRSTIPARIRIIDLSNLAYRAWHAWPNLSWKKWPTGAIYGVLKTLIALDSPKAPLYVVADRPPTRRQKLDTTYKAHRGERHEDMQYQLHTLEMILPAMGATVVALDEYEADEVIAGIAGLAVYRDIRSTIISSDSDFHPLISDLTQCYDPRLKRYQNMRWFKSVYPDFLHPSSLYLYKALRGDVSDGIPGVYGYGPEMARRLVIEWEAQDTPEKAFKLLQSKLSPAQIKQLWKANNLVVHPSEWVQSVHDEFFEKLFPVLKLAETSRLSKAKAQQELHDLGMKSLLKSFDRWFPFGGNQRVSFYRLARA